MPELMLLIETPDAMLAVMAALLAVPVTVGAAGAAKIGVTAELAVDADELALAPVATAVNVYAVPLVRPVTLHEVAGAVTVQVAPPGAAVTV